MFVRIVYTFVLFLLSPYLLYRLYRKKTNHPKFGSRWKEHFGLTPPLKTKVSPLWIHAVSVGESILAVSLVKKIKQEFPELPIVITTTTSTGAAEIAKLGDLAEHRYMPIDFGFAVRGFLASVHPKEMMIIETELWPNTIHYVSQAGIPITIVNARLSEKSYKNYQKIYPIFCQMIPALTRILCQTAADRKHFLKLGIKPEKTEITGSVKFDLTIPDTTVSAGKKLRERLGESRPVWIAASTHQGEEEQILQAHQLLLEKKPDSLLILVPRHPERFNLVYELCKSRKLKTIRRTSQDNVTAEHQVYLGDTMGEMLLLLGATDICFMGGSLIGDKVGGHNILEPAALGVPTLTGPSFFNFKEIMDQFIKNEAIIICSEPQDIAKQIIMLFDNHLLYKAHSESALHILQKNQGALKKTIQWITG
ncbi:3-deoxy-D-manno-octulosonic acid transferase [Vibrio aerogenes CECT 7868]|uniref:3-deoxy-D-manno-octulosonic acid transferase n=1 Tax=Vibrio aerogenes CECT 7868 TaxID=1216006 RepID=A0A1M5ZDN3_9VIBR|nr:lipid IV(A) 3-deoxy-D-manno-octulosonic acid transferase [Vibrio aerogenes]SHI22113.1 3-deoxy-D-manno-octulosonic acid transferase [Vibrio aerogenes CECT 7868]